MTVKQPVLIVLNGASSAGKTLAAQALMKVLGPSCVVTGFDDILSRVRPFGPEDGGPLAGLSRNARIAWFQLSDGRLRLFKALHREVLRLNQSGRDVVVETALMDRRALLDAAACFAALNALFVAMKPPLAVSEQWEASRGDRPAGQARKHYALIYAHDTYDFVLDPSTMTPEACASTILERLQGPPGDAFRRLLLSTPG